PQARLRRGRRHRRAQQRPGRRRGTGGRAQAGRHGSAPAPGNLLMDFGIFTMFSTREGSTQAQIFREWLSLVQVAEESGVDTLWLGESHFRPQRAGLASPLVGASAIAARTTRIRVGLAVQVLPLANAPRLP